VIAATELADEYMMNLAIELVDDNLLNPTIELDDESLVKLTRELADDNETANGAINAMINPVINIFDVNFDEELLANDELLQVMQHKKSYRQDAI